MHAPPRSWNWVGVACLALAGCAGPTFTASDAPDFLARRSTPFYSIGPLQPGPPDARLDFGERVRLLRREFGYSFAQLPDGRTGYVANEDLAPAPPRPTPAPTPVVSRSRSSRERSRPPRDLPAPVEEPLPTPDLEVAPADAPPPL